MQGASSNAVISHSSGADGADTRILAFFLLTNRNPYPARRLRKWCTNVNDRIIHRIYTLCITVVNLCVVPGRSKYGYDGHVKQCYGCKRAQLFNLGASAA